MLTTVLERDCAFKNVLNFQENSVMQVEARIYVLMYAVHLTFTETKPGIDCVRHLAPTLRLSTTRKMTLQDYVLKNVRIKHTDIIIIVFKIQKAVQLAGLEMILQTYA